jgi:hypothetical protein
MTAYATEAEGQTYMDTYRLVTSAWDAADSATRDKALAMSTRLIDQLSFVGDKADADQELQFPRGSDTTVPQDIKEACIECAYSLLDGVDVEYEYETQGMTSMGFANVRSSQSSGDIQEHREAGIPSYIAWRLLYPYLRDLSSVTLTRTS